MALIDKLNAIGDAIRAKTGKADKLALDQMPTEIASIETGGGGVDIQLLIDRTITEVSSASDRIGDYVFYGCTQLTKIDLPVATSIGNEAFYNCVKLGSVELPNVTRIAGSAFRLCSALTSLDLPSLTSIESNVFRNCGKLQSLILRSETVCTLGTNVFTSTPIASGTGYIYVPSRLVEGYKSATNWSAYAEQIRAIEDYPETTGS